MDAIEELNEFLSDKSEDYVKGFHRGYLDSTKDAVNAILDTVDSDITPAEKVEELALIASYLDLTLKLHEAAKTE